ncbi:MAG: hypothetical protein HON53_14450 [Planctomycetaceae bacterium]|nr:hypothetical protein [Planctomycetaceae bacterium]MBT6157362.1 hypothetical protein [Planctomycetaceae bacterium]MBT6483474.1 hypothetical protein [Planctomycetaceae bacterium]MBT6497094.1 hypothetical protein [Planctomycetaceae bacterium]
MPEIKINSEENDGHVIVTVTGRYGYGSGGNQHASTIVMAIDNAIDIDSIETLVIDLSGMQYEWGDAIARIFHKYPDMSPAYRLSAADSEAWNGLLAMIMPSWAETLGRQIHFV